MSMIIEILKNKLGSRGGSNPVKVKVWIEGAKLATSPVAFVADIAGVCQDEDGVMQIVTDAENVDTLIT